MAKRFNPADPMQSIKKGAEKTEDAKKVLKVAVRPVVRARALGME
jgi:hypothetical protein